MILYLNNSKELEEYSKKEHKFSKVARYKINIQKIDCTYMHNNIKKMNIKKIIQFTSASKRIIYLRFKFNKRNASLVKWKLLQNIERS